MRVLTPGTIDEACRILSGGGVIPVAGGTDLLVHWPTNLGARRRDYLDLSGIDGLRAVRWTDSELILGAGATYWDVIADPRARVEFPLLVSAARQVGAVQIQTRGTWAGNIVNASPAADGVPVLMAYGAVVDLRSVSGEESVALDSFYTGYKAMKRRPDQLVVRIRVPRRRHVFEYFEKVGARRAQLITKVGVAMTRSDAGWRVAANSVAPFVCRCPAVEALLTSRAALSGPHDLFGAIDADVKPIDDIRSTAGYRREVLGRLIYHALRNRGTPWVT